MLWLGFKMSDQIVVQFMAALSLAGIPAERVGDAVTIQSGERQLRACVEGDDVVVTDPSRGYRGKLVGEQSTSAMVVAKLVETLSS